VIHTTSAPDLQVAKFGPFVDDSGNPHSTNLAGADLQHAEIYPEASFESANLEGVQLQAVVVRKVNFKGAKLRRAKLQGADLEFCDLTGANLEDAELQGADLGDAILPGADSTVVMPEPPGSSWWRSLTTGSGEREIERATAEKVCRLIVEDVFGRHRAQQTPICFEAEGRFCCAMCTKPSMIFLGRRDGKCW
jgi:hypothetical protein